MNIRRSFLRAALAATTFSTLAAFGLAHADDAKPTTGRTTGEVVDDQTIETKVKTALIGADDVKARNIEVEVRDSVVYLTGKVASAAEAQSAVANAQRVAGVKSVKSTLVVQP